MKRAAFIETQFSSPTGTTWQLERYPQAEVNFRAWDAADEYLLQYCLPELNPEHKVLIINDSFGALTIALSDYQTVSAGDSYLQECGLEHNLNLNGLTASQGQWMDLDSLFSSGHRFDYVLLKLPKSIHLITDILKGIQPLLRPGAKVVAGAMIKYLRQSMIACFSSHTGSTHTTLARKKARLIVSQFDNRPVEQAGAAHLTWLALEEWPIRLASMPGIFSDSRLDIGTRFLLSHMEAIVSGVESCTHVIDLACGNGALGILANQLLPEAKISFCDISYRAIACARLSFEQSSDKRSVLSSPDFRVDDGLSHWSGGKVDLILCNPPFHDQQAMTTTVAMRLFEQAYRHLAKGGQLVVVANRHLPYLSPLKRRFRTVKMHYKNPKFTIYQAWK